MISSSLIARFIFDNYHLVKLCYDGGYYVYYIDFIIKNKLYKNKTNKSNEIDDDYVIL